jgi:bifunctional non-homologous end joining protein LigD
VNAAQNRAALSCKGTGLLALAMIAKRRRLGIVSCKSSSRLAAISVAWFDKPVMLPPGPDTLPSAGLWLHEIKHDGFRIIARKDGERVMLYSRPGNDFTRRFPLIVEALVRLRSRSCIIDGEAVACDDNGVASFDRIRHHRHNDRVFL